MAKEVIVVSKTHLDLGFTDLAANIKKKFLETYIPSAIKIAEELNQGNQKRFVWTTGSWLLKEALTNGGSTLREQTKKALKDGNIASHALPFTTHTELLDAETFKYGLSIVDQIDAISGTKTVAAKMTDVPGHTIAIVPYLAEQGIKLLHIGVNGASKVPNVPPCFLWKFEESEIVVIYSGGYGGEFRCPHIEQILYLDHYLDNRFACGADVMLKRFQSIEKQYLDYKVRAGRLDDIAEALWKVREKLPVVTSEIGDTWIHGIATDPYKTAALRTLCSFKTDWLNKGKMVRSTDEYRLFSDALLCVAEHTWGLDMKTHLADTEHYKKCLFLKARKHDIVKVKNPFGNFPYRMGAFISNLFGKKSYRYSLMEKSWAEQRDYVDMALSSLDDEKKKEAESILYELRQNCHICSLDNEFDISNQIKKGRYTLKLNSYGGVTLYVNGKKIIDALDKPLITYRSYGVKDYEYWTKNYTRNLTQTRAWALDDFSRPSLNRQNNYPQGEFAYKIIKTSVKDSSEQAEINVDFSIKAELTETLGAPKRFNAKYVLTDKGLNLSICWAEKDASRLTESISAHLYPLSSDVIYYKMGKSIDPKDVVSYGGRKLSVVESSDFFVDNTFYSISSKEAALIASDGGNLLKFDDKEADIVNNGLSYILYNNVWGTNFSLWYSENAKFTFSVGHK